MSVYYGCAAWIQLQVNQKINQWSIKMTTKKTKKADEEIQFTRPLTAKDKKHIAIYGRVLKYFRENGGRNSYAHLK